ncbi:kynurenine formamidase-like isoform X2 [Homarus americanus]|uniref:Kynurenine formamidase-like n=1 Tax=Homarus americanus TaxID=6706 RepID=A0A8J5JFP8_HOMAM|nr:kynurenine formamidase-like isoform X2 [Homarus americanus]KAG7153643.1 Kynurenine formamidase-like [Homarus americanus]
MGDTVKTPATAHHPWAAMNQEELEAEYSPSRWSKRHGAQQIIGIHVKVATDLSQVAFSLTHRLNIPYSDQGPRAKLDVFGEDLPAESVLLVYVHGGYWQQMNKEVSSLFVKPLYHAGVVTVVVGYDLAPQVSLERIVSEVRAAVLWACKLARERGSKGVVLAGWSAGAQLVTQVLSTPEVKGDTPSSTDLTPYKDLIGGVVTFSGVFDLRPLVKTSVNEPLHLTDSTAWAMSPLASVGVMGRARPSLRLLISVGQHDSPEFKRQSKEYCQACVEAGMRAECVVVEGMDHFSIVEDLAQEKFSLTQRIVSFVKLCTTSPHADTPKHDKKDH